ncbi:MAG: peptidylprolyl isomerase [Thermoanaerobaculaceae bacterium]|nr:peptidylprolyl isomerase [Thermoanaerobaculaceae bacterium]
MKRTLVVLLLLVATVVTADSSDPGVARATLLALGDARRFDRETLAALAVHPDAAVRTETARVLGRLDSLEALPLLETLAGDREVAVRAAAVEAVGRLGLRWPAPLAASALGQAGRVLTAALGDPAPRVRAAACWAAPAVPFGKRAELMVRRAVQDPDLEVRARALAELWRDPGKDWVPTAVAAAGHSDPRVRLAAVWSLSRGGDASADAALAIAAASTDPAVRVVALDSARRGHARALWTAAVRATGSQNGMARTAAFLALAVALDTEPGRTLPPAVTARLATTITTRDSERAQERVAAIRLAGLARVAEKELLVLRDGDEAWLAGEAAAALGRFPGQAEATLRLAATDADPRQLAVAGVLAKVPGSSAAIKALLESPVPALRITAVDAAAERGGEELLNALVARLDDADVAVRASALEALGNARALPPVAALLERLARESGSKEPDAAVGIIEVVKWAEKPRYLEIVTQRGTLQVALNTADAPLECHRLWRLADDTFFENLMIHRVVPTFVVQGGDPRGDGWGGPGFTLRHEDSLAPYQPGAVGLAHGGPDTAGSQLFVTLTRQPHLDGRYPVVGKVVNGLDVAERLRVGDRILRVKTTDELGTSYPIWYGPIAPARLDAEIKGWSAEREKYEPKDSWVEMLASARLRYELVVAMGTWCGDSREQIPRLQAVLARLGPRSPFGVPRLVGVDRSKWIDRDQYPFGAVELVPTIVVTAGGSEIGRIVETPASGRIEEDLARILAPVEGWEVPEAEHE